MRTYMEVGERQYYNKKRFICREGNVGCEGCDLASYVDTPKELCGRVLCKSHERPDGKNVVFRLQPKYRREVKGGKE